jgi:hypothetical protein
MLKRATIRMKSTSWNKIYLSFTPMLSKMTIFFRRSKTALRLKVSESLDKPSL